MRPVEQNSEERTTDWAKTDWPDPILYDEPTQPHRPAPWRYMVPAFLLGVGFTVVLLKLLGAL